MSQDQIEALYGPGGPLYNTTAEFQEEFLARMVYGQNKGLSLGPYFIGLVIDMFCFGVVITQFIRWLGHSKEDRIFTKIVVYSTITLSISYSVYAIVYHMQNWVYNFGSYANFAKLVRMMFFVLGDAVTATIVQIFFAHRAYLLLGPQRRVARNVFAVLVGMSICLELAGATAGVVLCVTKIKVLFDGYKIEPVLYCWLGGSLSADIFITVVSAWVLFKSKTGWSNTDRTINKLIKFIVETQFPPTVIAFVYMVYYSQNPQSTIIIALSYAMCKPYVIGLLALLNDRDKMRKEMDTFHTHGNNFFKSTRHGQPTVHVHTETYAESHPAAQFQLGLNRRQAEEYHEMEDKDFKDSGSDFGLSPRNENTSTTRLTYN